MVSDTKSRIESELEVKAYLQNLRYALDNGAEISFQSRRLVDEDRDKKFTNEYTVDKLFANEDVITALTRELRSLTVEEYIRTVKDMRFPNRSEMREFGKVYNGNEDVYIKIRVEVIGINGKATTFIMSFHFAEKPFRDSMFPYRKKEASL